MAALDNFRRVTGLRDSDAHLVPVSQPRPDGTTLCGQSEHAFLHSGREAEGKPTCEVCRARVNEIGRVS